MRADQEEEHSSVSEDLLANFPFSPKKNFQTPPELLREQLGEGKRGGTF